MAHFGPLTGCGKSQPISLGGAAPGEKESRGAAVRNIRALTAVPPYQSFAHAVPRRGGHLFPQPVKRKDFRSIRAGQTSAA